MNREDIIAMAREAGFDLEMWQLSLGSNVWGTHEELERFAALVAAAERNRTWTQDHWTEYERSIAAVAKAEEREACAKVCDETLAQHYMKQTIPERDEALFLAACVDCAAAIRARGQA